VNVGIRAYRPDDEERIVELSLRAWQPVFASIEEILGPEIFVGLHGDWRVYQEQSVRRTLADDQMTIWVADVGRVVGFVAARVANPERHIGELYMLAVDPNNQEHGVGIALTERATDWMRDAGMRVAMIFTGGDPGHAPARRVYEKAAYTLLPTAGYYKAL
jgi:GNAT superfamily N-acetyltransferase